MRGAVLCTTLLSLTITSVSTAKKVKVEERTTESTKSNIHKRASGITWNGWDASGQTFDYVVVGGGLTGITVASRLTETPGTTVLIIESGGDNRFDDRVQNIYTYGQAFNSELDWAWPADSGRTIAGYVDRVIVAILKYILTSFCGLLFL